jgi:hypothetical protein
VRITIPATKQTASTIRMTMTCRNCPPAGSAAVTGDSNARMPESVFANSRMDR